jgi:transposase
MDMWDPYISSTLEHVPGTHGKIVFDRFHVMRHVNEAVDTVRKDENRELVKKGIMDLKSPRYIWLYSSENLPEKYSERYNTLKNSDLRTGKAYSMKENIRSLWNLASLDEARDYWNRWY